MLDTLLHIGKTLRREGLLRHHRYINLAPLPDKKSPVVYYSLPVSESYNFDFDSMNKIKDEKAREKLFYLRYKAGESDTLVKYIFGDILYGTDKKGGELGYYRMGKSGVTNAYALSSFKRAEEDAKFFEGTEIEKFRVKFAQNLERIESLLREYGKEQQIFLHFDFNGKHWYEFEPELEAINKRLLDAVLDEQKDFLILRNFLYKTLLSGASHAPGFRYENAYKNRGFRDRDEVMDLLYALTYSKKPLISERNIKIVVLPKGENLEANHIEDFFERNGIENEEETEKQIAAANQKTDTEADELDSLFAPVLEDVPREITQFDFVFSKKGNSASTPDVDMLELSGVERSFLAELSKRVKRVREPLHERRTEEYPKRPKQYQTLDIRKSFLNILGDVTSDKKKYQSHLFKVLPQIYSGTYYRDDVLLPAFIEKVEYNTRDPNASIQPKMHFNLLKYDYEFLVRLRNVKEDSIADMKNSKSYQAGLLLGRMAQPLDRKIASFEKNYVGLLSRRISDKQGLMKFANFINEKLAIHDVAYPNLKQASVQLATLVSEMDDAEYRKNQCAFGFFEGYFGRSQNATPSEPTNGNQENENNQ
jgi:hypothetical protein